MSPKAAVDGETTPPFDPESLPPIESITAGSDIRAFLQKGVPRHLTQAALRRVWTTDPAIRDFIGIAENQWDFTDPTAMPGFGPLAPSDDVGKLVAQAMGKLDELTEPASEASPPIERSAPAPTAALTSRDDGAQTQTVGMPQGMQQGAERSAAVEAQQSEENAAPQQATASAEGLSARNRRGHGSALPK
jgi:hypothetical protein